MKILNIGSLNLDYVYSVDHIVKEGETESSNSFEIFAGGKGLNQYVALSKAGVDVFHCGIIGSEGKIFFDVFKKYGIKTDYLKQISGQSGHAIIQVDRQGQNSILLYQGANQQFTTDFIHSVLENFEKDDMILLQNEINKLDYIIDKANEKNMCVVLNPSPFNEKINKCDLSKVNIFLVNEIEGAQITGEKESDLIISKMKKLFPNAKIVLTLGSDGVIYADRENIFKQDIFKTNVVDTTAAGDTFTGYFLAGLIEKMPIPEILKMSSKASSIAVSRRGATDSIPMRCEVK